MPFCWEKWERRKGKREGVVGLVLSRYLLPVLSCKCLLNIFLGWWRFVWRFLQLPASWARRSALLPRNWWLASGTGPVARVHASSGHPSDNLRIWGSASFMSWGVKCNKSVQIHKWIPRKIFKFHQNLTQQCPKEDFLVMSRTLSSASMLASPTTGGAASFTSRSGSPPFKHLHGSLPMTPEQTCETTGSNLRRQHKKSLKCVDFWHQFWPNQLHQYAGIIL